MVRIGREMVLRGQRSYGYNPPERKNHQRTPHMAMFDAWVEGPAARGRLIHEGRQQGFDGLAVEKYISRGLVGNKTNSYYPPLYSTVYDLFYLFWEGVYANLIQHGGGEGIYLWRENRQGYEFLMFDYGPGAHDRSGHPQEHLGLIFDEGVSFRRGEASLADGVRHGGGLGYGSHYIGCDSYLTRVVSMCQGWVRVVDKEPGARQGEPFHMPTVQWDFSFADNSFQPHGFLVHGFVPANRSREFRGRFLPVSEQNIIGPIEVDLALDVKRGSWQLPPAKGLDDLRPGDRVTVVYYEFREETKVVEETSYLQTLPRFPDLASFKLTNGHEVNSNCVKSLNRRLVFDGMGFFQEFRSWRLGVGSEVTLKYETTVVVDERIEHEGIIAQAPTDENEGVFIFEDGLTLGCDRIKQFKLVV